MGMNDARPMESLRARLSEGGLGRGLVRTLVAVALIAVGAVGAVVVLQYTGRDQLAPGTSQGAHHPAEPHGGAASSATPPDAEVEIVLSPEAVERAGIKTARVAAMENNVSVQVPGIVMANAYREVKVTPILGGIVTQVYAELGAAVKRGTPLATLFSAELAEAQTKFLAAKAMLAVDDRKLQRAQQLVGIGAASRQEFEEIMAVHAGHATEVEAARQRLLLLGLTPEHVEALTNPHLVVSEVVVAAPIDGVITGRSANLGQVVGMGMELFVVTDLSQVWVVGDLYEQDFQSVNVGSAATLTLLAYPTLLLRGLVAYIDPRVDPMTRTAKVRVEVLNPDGRLRLGMYASMAFTTRSSERVPIIPRTAIQTMGDRHVVFLPVSDEEGKFVQRTVRIGQTMGETCAILSGLEPGEVVVTEGSFYLRAESLRTFPSG
jgi:RND family efflux transporter MFP subunit